MPKKPKNPQPTPKQGEIVQTTGEIKISPLSPRQESALPHIIAAPTIAHAARNAGISETTLRRWLTDHAFRQELTRHRQETTTLTQHELRGVMLQSITVIAESLKDPNPTIRLRAARYALSFGIQINEIQNLSAGIQSMEQTLRASSETRPVNLDPSP